MDKLEMYLINNLRATDITNYLAESIVNEGEYRSCCRTLSFSLLKDKVNIKVGDTVRFIVNNHVQFYGIITSKDISTDSNIVELSCKDAGIYLKRNSFTYKFRNATPRSIVERICKDFSIPYTWAYDLNTRITRNFINVNLYNIIMTAYTLNSTKKFCIQFDNGKLNVLERGAMAEEYIMHSNLISATASENIDNMVNVVNIYNSDDKIIRTIQNENDRKLYGQFNEYIKLGKDDKRDYIKEANKKLQGIEQKISVGCFGNSTFTTGKAVIVETPGTFLKGKYYIDSDTHTWKNGIYTNKLALNLKSIMDECEDGSLEESSSYKKSSSSRRKKVNKKEDYSVYTNRLKE